MPQSSQPSKSNGAFDKGERVRVSRRLPQGHCRAPFYLRGQIGEIVALHGLFRDPEKLAYNKPGLPQVPLYKVRFQQSELWTGYGGAMQDTLEADIAENWLERI